MDHSDVNFCMKCGNTLQMKTRFGANRPTCTSCNYTHFFDPKVAAAMWLMDQNKLLLVKRAVEPEKGLWTLPGGFVDAWEHPADTAVRECLEETGLKVQAVKMIDLVTTNYDSKGNGFIIFYTGKILSGRIKAGDDADDVAWFDINDLPTIAFDATKSIIKNWKNNQFSMK